MNYVTLNVTAASYSTVPSCKFKIVINVSNEISNSHDVCFNFQNYFGNLFLWCNAHLSRSTRIYYGHWAAFGRHRLHWAPALSLSQQKGRVAGHILSPVGPPPPEPVAPTGVVWVAEVLQSKPSGSSIKYAGRTRTALAPLCQA